MAHFALQHGVFALKRRNNSLFGLNVLLQLLIKSVFVHQSELNYVCGKGINNRVHAKVQV